MNKSTYRVVKSIGLILFLVLFGVFIYVMAKSQKAEQRMVKLIPRPSSGDPEIKIEENSQRQKIGFDYQQKSNEDDNEI